MIVVYHIVVTHMLMFCVSYALLPICCEPCSCHLWLMCLFYSHLQYPCIIINNSDWIFAIKQCTHTYVPKECQNFCQELQYPHKGLQKDLLFMKKMQYLCLGLQSNRYWLTCFLHLIYHIRVLCFGIGFSTSQFLWTIYQIMQYPHKMSMK